MQKCLYQNSLCLSPSKSQLSMHRQKLGMSQFLLPLILSSLLIATSATFIPTLPDLSAGININITTPSVTQPQNGPIDINLPSTPIPKVPGPQGGAPNIDPALPVPQQPEAGAPKTDLDPDPTLPPQQPQDPSSLNTDDGHLAREFLHLHNYARLHAKLPPYVWDVKLEEYAKQYASKRANSDCELIHSNGPYGENLFWGGGPMWTPKDAVKRWIKEHKFYDQNANECKNGKVCGHYTQVVWRDSTRMGCAVERCKNNDTFTVCSYDPPGNYLGEKPNVHYDH